jgi:hypothetical protein
MDQLKLARIGDPSTVRLRPCRRVPVSWIPGNKNVEAVAFWNSVFLRDIYWPIDPQNRTTIELLFHELIHVEQFRRSPFLFPIKYLVDHLRYGYWNNPAEVEARDRASKLTSSYFAQTG